MKTQSLRHLLTRQYVTVVLSLFVFATLFVAVTLRVQSETFEGLLREKIDRLIATHRSELLGQIALDDQHALEGHLRYFLDELYAHAIRLETVARTYSVEDPDHRASRLRDAIAGILGIKGVATIQLSNSSGYLNAKLTVNYRHAFFDRVLAPHAVSLGVLVTALLGAIGITFAYVFRSLRSAVLLPLQRLGDRTANFGQGSGGIAEIASIEAAIVEQERSKLLVGVAHATQMLAHDVRRPFSMLRIGLDHLARLEGSPARLADAAKRMRTVVEEAIDNVEGLIADVLEASTSDANLSQQPTTLGPIISKALATAFASTPESSIKFRFSISHNRPLFVDDGKVVRAFTNILDNARQAMKGVGTITIDSSQVKVGAEDMARITIHNTDSFIPEDDQRQLFEAFFTKGKKGGTGLGLAIVKKIVKAHGGDIRCESSPTSGTAFVVHLPLAQSGVETDVPLPLSHAELKRLFIARLGGESPTLPGVSS